MKLAAHLNLELRSRMLELYIHSIVSLHEVVLNELSSRIIVPLLHHSSGIKDSQKYKDYGTGWTIEESKFNSRHTQTTCSSA
jgi:hypothetical protein